MTPTTEIHFASAKFSDCGKYRYWLYRRWDKDLPTAMCIGLNPSTANGTENDPTIDSIIRILKFNGYGAFYMTNLFAWISPKWKDLRSVPDPVADNDTWLDTIASETMPPNEYAKGRNVVFCWGNFPIARYRAKKIIPMFPGAMCLIKNQDGTPRHPLYVKEQTPLIKFK